MKNLEEVYKDRFRKEQISYKESEVETLWEKIDQNLHPPRRKSLVRIALFIIAILILIYSVVRLSFSDNLSNGVSSKAEAPIVSNTTNRYNELNDPLEKEPKTNESFTVLNVESTVIDKNVADENDHIQKQDKKFRNKIAFPNRKQNILLANELNKANVNRYDIEEHNYSREFKVVDKYNSGSNFVHKESYGITSKVKLSKDNQFIPSHAESLFVEKKGGAVISLLDNYTILPIKKRLLSFNQRPNMNFEFSDYSKSNSTNSTLSFELGLSNSILKSFIGFGGGDENFRNQLMNTEKGIWGSRQELELKLILGSWRFGSGLGMQDSRTQFNYERTLKTTVLKENQLVAIIIDPESLDTIGRQYQDTVVNRTIYRKVVHNNILKQISIPLRVGFQMDKKDFVFGIDVGVSFNWIKSQSGKTLSYFDNIIEYTDGDLQKPFTDFSLSYNLRPFIQYKFSQKIGLNLFSELIYQKHTKNSNSLSRSLWQIGPGIGINYKM